MEEARMAGAPPPGEGEEVLRDTDGTRLLFTEEVAQALGIEVSTVRWKNAAAKRQRAQRKKTGILFPPPARHVRRTKLKADGRPVTSNTPVWREDRILAYRRNRLGPGGRPVAGLGKEAG